MQTRSSQYFAPFNTIFAFEEKSRFLTICIFSERRLLTIFTAGSELRKVRSVFGAVSLFLGDRL